MHSGAELPSTELLSASRAGDRDALEVLLCRHLNELRAFVRLRISPTLRAYESQSDLVQSVCREVLSHPERFQFQGEAQFKNWLYGAVLNKVGTKEQHLRAERRDIRRQEGFVDTHLKLAESYAAFVDAGEAAILAEEIKRVEAAFDQLSEEQREVLTLQRFVGLPHKEIAQHLGKTEQAVRMIAHRGVARLSTLMGD